MRKVITISLFAILFAFVANSAACYAAGSVDLSNLKDNDEALMKRALATAAINCYKDDVARDEITIGDFNENWKNIFLKKGSTSEYSETYKSTNTKYALAPMFNSQHKLREGWIGCQEAFEGGGKIKKGLSGFYTMPTTLEGMGYTKVNSGQAESKEEYEITFYIKQKGYSGGYSKSTLTVSFDEEDSPKVYGIVSLPGDKGYSYVYAGDSKPKQVKDPSHPSGYDTNVSNYATSMKMYTGGNGHMIKCDKGEKHSDCVERFAEKLNQTIGLEEQGRAQLYDTKDPKTKTSNVEKSKTDSYMKNDDSAKKMLKNIGYEYGVTNKNGTLIFPTWDDDAKYSLYLHALVGVMKKYKGDVSIDCNVKDGEEGVYFFYNKKDSKCYINITPENSEKIKGELVNTVPEDGTALKKGIFSDALDWLSKEHPGITKYLDANEAALEAGEISDGDDVEGEKDEFSEACSKQAQSLGWIICPVINGLKGAVGGIYSMVEPMIRVGDGVLNQLKEGIADGGGPTYEAWSFFRNIANVIFVILFLVIIFSQLTGFGIDNYGIKKMLPKIIVTAILVNLSFLICAVLIDVSNVIGRAIQDLFITLGEKVGNNTLVSADGPSITGSVSGVIESICSVVTVVGSGALVVGGVGAGLSAALTGGWAIIIPIFLFLVSAVIAVLFALAILGIRQALIVVLIVISPIVFACTLLPNTETVYKKWKDLFVKILTVYPVVSMLIGAGYFTAKILYTDENDLFMGIIAGVLLLGPYFAVPSLVKKSLAAAGNIGAMLSGRGDALRGRVKGVANSDKVKDLRERSRAKSLGTKNLNKLTMAAAKKFNGKDGKIARLVNHTIASTGRLDAVAKANKTRAEKGHTNALRNAINSEYTEENLATKAYNDMTQNWKDRITNGNFNGIDKNDTKALSHELEEELKKGGNADTNKIRALQDVMLANGAKGAKNELADISKKYAQGTLKGEEGANMAASMKHFYDNLKNTHGSEIDSFADLAEAAKAGSMDGILKKAKKDRNGDVIGYTQLNYKDLLHESLNTMSDEKMSQMSAYTINEIGKNASEEDKQAFKKYAEAALASDKLKNSIKNDARQAMEEHLNVSANP